MKKYSRNYSFRVIRFVMIGLVTSLLTGFLIEYFHLGFDNKLIVEFIFINRTQIYLLSVFIFFLIYTGVTSLFGSSIIGSFLTILLTVILGITSHLKYIFRSEPLYPSELFMITELPFLMDMITTSQLFITVILIIVILSLMFFIYHRFSLKKRIGILSFRVHIIWRLVLLTLSSLGLFYTYKFNNPGNLINEAYSNTAKWVSYDQNKNYSNNGFVAGFLFNTGSQYMTQPIDYSKEKVISIKNEYTIKAEEINKNRNNIKFDTNIIFLMNESFSDPIRIKGFESNLDPIPYTRELMKNTLSGNSFAQSIGGGTANSEFEALTSLSLEPFSSHVYAPYVEATSIFNHIPSILERVHSNGLVSTAIHPHSPSLYKRSVVYSEMGFDKFISNDDMSYTEKIANSDYISDESAYKEMIKRMNETEEKDFIHLVTMQNHMSYRLKYDKTKFITSGANDNEEGDGYLQDLYNSDLALEKLINHINQHDEEILLVFWGDHLPGIYSNTVGEKNSALTRRETPLFFYSNVDELYGDVGTISPIYYLNHVLSILNNKVTPFEALLMELEENLPGLYGGLYVEEAGKEPLESRNNLNVETRELLDKYSLIQYDMVSGSRFSREVGFFDIPK